MATCPTCGATYQGVQFCAKDGARLLTDGGGDTRIGEIVGGRYRLLEKAGEGGMGEVYRAEHLYIQRQLALKLLKRDLAQHGEAVQRLQREAHSTSGIGHPNIVRIEDFGHLDDGTVFLAMEWLEGATLDDLLESGNLELRDGLELAIQICEGLFAAHESGVIHRDLKPANVFVTTDQNEPVVKLLDFGIARLVHSESHLTKSGTFLGTPHYMPPEQARGEPVGVAGDIYSLGVILYELATGSLPFESETFMGVLHKKASEPPPSPSDRAPGRSIPASLEQTIVRSLSPVPEQRHATALELRDELKATLAELAPSQTGASASAAKRTTVPGIAAAKPPASATRSRKPPTAPRSLDAAPSSGQVHADPSESEPIPPAQPVSPPMPSRKPPSPAAKGSTGVSSPVPASPAESPPRPPVEDEPMDEPGARRGKTALFVVLLVLLLGGTGAGLTLLLIRDTATVATGDRDAAGATALDAGPAEAAGDAAIAVAEADATPTPSVADAGTAVAEEADADGQPSGGQWTHRGAARGFDFEIVVSPRPVSAGQPAHFAVSLTNTTGAIARALEAGTLRATLRFSYYRGHDNYPGPSTDVGADGRFALEWTPPRDGKYHVYVVLEVDGRRVGRAKYDICVGHDPDAPASELRSICPNLNPR